jgi:hypothetical protein
MQSSGNWRETLKSAKQSLLWPFDKELMLIGATALLAVAAVAGFAYIMISTPGALLGSAAYIAEEILVPLAACAVLYGLGAAAKKAVSWFKKPAAESRLPAPAAPGNASAPAFPAGPKAAFNAPEDTQAPPARRDAPSPASARPGRQTTR